MRSTTDPLSDGDLWTTVRLVTLVLLVLAITCFSLLAAGVFQGHWWPAAVGPYGFASCVVTNVLATCPLAWYLVLVWDRSLAGRLRWVTGWVSLLLAGGVTLATVLNCGKVENVVADSNEVIHWIVRFAWPLLLGVLWFGGLGSVVFRQIFTCCRIPVTWLNLLVALLLALVVPAVYATHLKREQTSLAERRRIQGQTYRAWYLVDRLTALGSAQLVSGQTPAQQRSLWSLELEKAKTFLDEPLAANADIDTDLRRARNLLAWSERDEDLDQVIEILSTIVLQEPRALLLRTAVYGIREEWLAVIDDCQKVVTLLDNSSASVLSAHHWRQQAYTRWAEALRQLGRYRQSQTVLEEGLERWPSDGFFHFQVAQHHERGGRPQQAIAYYLQAKQKNSKWHPPADRAIARLRADSPACFLRSVRLSTR